MSSYWDFDAVASGVRLVPADPDWDGVGDGEEPPLRRAFRTLAARLGVAYVDMYALDDYDGDDFKYGRDPEEVAGLVSWSGNWLYADQGRLELRLPPSQLVRMLADLLARPE